MIEPLPHMPAGTLGFRLSGTIRREEYRDVLLPALRAEVEAGEVRLVCEIGSDLEEFTPGALWEDTKVGARLGIGHHGAWKRTAVVTDLAWVRRGIELFAWMTPGEVRVLDPDQLDEAKAWVAEGQAPA
jgi:hypothetical protein